MAVESLITQHIDTWTSAVKTKSTSGRGSSKKLELYGVKKLRELILELAVRGKLVPQDPSDEPASVLFHLIKEEQTTLVKEKKIKKQKKLPKSRKPNCCLSYQMVGHGAVLEIYLTLSRVAGLLAKESLLIGKEIFLGQV